MSTPFCVYKDKKFKELAKSTNTSEDALEIIVHRYVNETGDRENLPPVDYINAQYKAVNKVTKDEFKDLFTVWRADYSSPIIVNTVKEAEQVKAEALTIFNDEAVVVKPLNNGTFQITVAHPELYTITSNNYYEGEHTQVENFSNDTRLTKSLEENKKIGLKDIIDILQNSEYSGIVEYLSTKRKDKSLLDGVTLVVDNPFNLLGGYTHPIMQAYKKRRAYYDASTKTIHINGYADFANGDASSVIMHEIMHAITVEKIKGNEELRKEFDLIINKYLEEAPRVNYRYVKELNPDTYMEEFIADAWSNPNVIKILNNIKIQEKESLFDKIKKFFKKLFSDISSDSLFAKVSVEIDKLLDSSIKGNTNKVFYEGEIVYNAEQQEAIDAAVDHIIRVQAGVENQKFFTIIGKAGTGKTTSVDGILDALASKGKSSKFYKPVVITGAVSHKASQVIGKKLNNDKNAERYRIQSYSIASMLGLRPDYKGNFVRDKNILQIPINNANIVFIDEASMITETELKLIKDAIEKKNVPVIFLGDTGQLPPIRENKYGSESDALSPVFTDKSIPQKRLITRVRQGEESPILSYGDKFWDFSHDKIKEFPLDMEETSKVSNKGALIIQRGVSGEHSTILEQLIPLFEEAKRTRNPNLVKIVAYHNAEIDKYNTEIRNRLYKNSIEEGYHIDDLIIFNDSYGIPSMGGVANSTEAFIINKGEIREVNPDTSAFAGLELKPVKIQDVTIKTDTGDKTVPALIIDDINIKNYKDNLSKLSKYGRKLYESSPGSYYMFKEFKERYGVLIANIGYAYAITSHKSQGSTYEVTAVDTVDINKNTYSSLKTKARSIYTGLTRSSNVTIILSATTNDDILFTDIKGINDRINAYKRGEDVEDYEPETERIPIPKITLKEAQKTVKGLESQTKKTTTSKKPISDEDKEPAFDGEIGDYDDSNARSWGDFSSKSEPKTKEVIKTKVKPVTPQEIFNKFIAEQSQLNSIIEFDERTHTYYINGKEADYSVTEFKDFILGNEKDSDNEFLKVASRIGTSHDNFLRDFFAGKLQKEYPNISEKQYKTLKESAEYLKASLTEAYGEKSIFITDEKYLRTAAQITYNGETYLVAGTLDMIVIDEDGKGHIIDFKTHRANLNEDLRESTQEEYAIQVALYKAFITSGNNGLAIEDDTAIAQFNVSYSSPDKANYSFRNNQVFIEERGKNVLLQDSKMYNVKGIYQILVLNNDLDGITVTPLKTNLQKRVESKNLAADTKINKAKTSVRVEVGKPIEINSYSKKFGILSNFGEKSFIVDGKEFPTVEHYFQYQKARVVGNFPMAEKIRKLPTAMSAKKFGSHILKMSNEDIRKWDKISRGVMKKGMREAFKQNEDAKELLLSTGNSLLTHKLGGPFADILMELREEFGGYGKPETEESIKEETTSTIEKRIKALEDRLTETTRIQTTTSTKSKEYKGLTKVISGVQTGVDTLGLEIAHELGYETAGTAAPGFVREKNQDAHTRETLEALGVKEISKELQRGKSGKEFYLPRTEQNVLNSDGTVYFATDEDLKGKGATERFAVKHGKPFLLNPTAKELKEWLNTYKIETLNIAGNRGSKLSNKEEVAAVLREALTPEKFGNVNTPTLTPEELEAEKKRIEEEELAKAEERIKKVKRTQAENTKIETPEYNGSLFDIKEEAPMEGCTSSYTIKINDTVTNAEGVTIPINIIDGSKSLEIFSLISSLPFSSSFIFNPDTEISANYLFVLDHLLRMQRLFPIYGNKSIIIDPSSDLAVFAKSYSKLNYNRKTGELRIPMFTVGYTYPEIVKMDKREKLLNNGLMSTEELRSLSKATVCKVSEFITKLSTYKNEYEVLFKTDEDTWKTDPNKNRDFTQMSRIEIINTIGLHKLFDLVRTRVFDTTIANDDISFDTQDKMNVIFDNWEAFIELGYDVLANMESTSLDNKTNTVIDIKTDLNGEITNETDSDIVQEIFGSDLEHWQVGFRQVSTISSLSQMIKNTLGNLYKLDENGEIILNAFGLGENLNIQEAVSKILLYTQGATSLDEKDEDENYSSRSMIGMLKERLNSDPWLSQVLNLLEDHIDEDGNTIKADEQFKSQFYSNFKKYFQKYAIIYKKGKGKEAKTLIRVINNSTANDILLDSCKSKENSFATGAFNLKTKTGAINDNTLKRLKELNEKFLVYASKSETPHETITDLLNLNDYHSDIKEALNLLSIDAPIDENLYSLFGVKKNLQTFSKKLDYLLKSDLSKGMITSNNDYKQIVGIIAKESNNELEAVSYEAGKLYYSYVLPSYLNELITRLKSTNLSEQEFENVIEREYLQYSWFYKDGKIRNRWLNRIVNSQKVRENLEHVCLLHYMQTEYTDKTSPEYIASMLKMYFFDENKRWAYFRVPTMSNKPSEEYIKFERVSDVYQDTITNYLYDVFEQEIDRINAVLQRTGKLKDAEGNSISPIENYQKITSKGKKATFDKNGAKFCFLDWIQEYVDGSYKERLEYKNFDAEEKEQEDRFAELINKKLYSTLSEENNESAETIELFNEITKKRLNERFNTQKELWKDQGFITVTTNKKGEETMKVFGEIQYTEEQLREFFWNDFFAASQILQLTISDIALYVDTEDLQKRLAQLHAPGMRANILARDSKGNLYSKDGKARFLFLQDDIVKSTSYANLEDAISKIIADTPKERREHVQTQLDGLLKAFSEINFADAQGYSCPSSYRKKMGMFGKWDSKMEMAYEKLLHPEQYPDTNVSDLLDVLWQPLKPFVYSQVSTPGYNDFLPTIKTGIQIKDSEYVLIMADALLRRTSTPSRLTAIYNFMEDSQHDENGYLNGEGIDSVVFMSAVNTGCTGVINLNDERNKNNDVIHALTQSEIYERLQVAYIKDDEGHTIYNPDFVKEIDFRDYMIQQEVPVHFKGHSQAHGSQDRILTIAGLKEVSPTGSEYTLRINDKEVSVKEAKANYFEAIAKNIEEDVNKIAERFNLNVNDRKLRNIAISRLLQQEIAKDARYGYDLLWACSTNKYGEFNIPLSDPIQSSRIQQLLNSIIKNNVNKQLIAGGPVVQVSNWGVSDELIIRWQNSDHKLLLTEKEFNSQNYPTDYADNYQQVDGEKTYKEYLYDQAGVAYFECYATLPDSCIAEDFTSIDEKGNEFIDIEKIKKVAPKLLDMVSYRIPTEAKYSMAPLKIKGFLPTNGGEALMLPAEITTLAGSDFDIDKDYIMRYEFKRIKDEKTGEVTYIFPETGRAGRNNLIVATQLAMLQSEQVVKSLFTPGNFDEPKEYGYLISYVQNEAKRTNKLTEDIYKETENLKKTLSKDEYLDWLKDHNKTYNNLLYNYTQVKFHKQNMVAGKMIGIFAQANVSHAFINLEKNAYLDIPEENRFTLNNVKVEDAFMIDRDYTYDNRIEISSGLAAFLAASVDAVKDPILNLVNINTTTANFVVALLRMGFDIETVSLLCSQPIIRDLVKEFEIRNANRFVSIEELIFEKLKNFSSDILAIDNITVTKDQLIYNLKGGDEQTNYMVLEIFKKMIAISSTFGDITHMTRYNSITSAVGPFAADTVILRMKDNAFYNNPMISDSVKHACGALIDDSDYTGNPVLIAFREGPKTLERKILGENLIQASDNFAAAINTLSKILGFSRGVPSKIANAFSDFYMSYYVNDDESGNSVFDLSYEHRKEVLSQFPIDFAKIKSKYSDNLLVNSIQSLTSDREEYPYLSLKTRGMSSSTIEDLKQAWVSLYLNPESSDLAIKLVEYWFFRGSFGFNPKTAMNLVPNIVKMGLNNYIRILNNKTARLEDQNSNRVILQFILHNPKLITERYTKLENYSYESIDTSYGKGIIISKSLDNDSGESEIKPILCNHPIIMIDNKAYYVVNNNEDSAELIQVDLLGGNGQGIELSTTEDFPKSVYSQELHNNRQDSFSQENEFDNPNTIGIVISNIFDGAELLDIINTQARGSQLEKINTKLEDMNYNYRYSNTAKIRNSINKVLTKVRGMSITEVRNILNTTAKTLEDIKLC